MSRFNLRKRARVCYYEPEEPPFDEYVFCTECRDYVYEYCSIHGPMLVILDDKVGARTGFPAFVPRAALTIPRVFLHLAYSRIPEAGLGVFSTLTLPVGVRFGPYRGQRVQSIGDSNYGWQIYDRSHKPLHIVDARDPNNSNWMRYVNCSRHHAEQNLVAYQYQGQLYYRTVKEVPRFSELLVFYGSEFANRLGVDLRAYRGPCPCPKCQARLAAKKTESSKTNKRKAPIEEKKEKPSEKIAKKNQEPSASSQDLPSSTNIQEKKKKLGKKKDKKESLKKVQEPSAASQDDLPSRTDIQLKKEKLTEKNAKTNYPIKSQDSSAASQDLPSSTDIQEVTPGKPAVSRSSSVVNTLTAETNFKCEKCGKGFNTKSDLEKHINTHMLMKANTSHKASKVFTCKTCKSTFHTKLLLQEHEKSRHGVKYFACDKCQYATKHASNLQAHLRTHTGEKLFKCSQCSSAFSQSNNLQKHLRTHTGEKPFKCSHCSSAFSESGSLKKHLRTHTGEKPFKCSHCSSAFSESGSLKKHLRTHTGEKPFECNICDYKTTGSSALKRHIMSLHSGQKPFGCDACNYRGATRSNLTRHMKTHHKSA